MTVYAQATINQDLDPAQDLFTALKFGYEGERIFGRMGSSSFYLVNKQQEKLYSIKTTDTRKKRAVKNSTIVIDKKQKNRF